MASGVICQGRFYCTGMQTKSSRLQCLFGVQFAVFWRTCLVIHSPVLSQLLDDNRELFIPETQETVKAHSRFMLFATQNPPGQYGGRKVGLTWNPRWRKVDLMVADRYHVLIVSEYFQKNPWYSSTMDNGSVAKLQTYRYFSNNIIS